MATSTSTHFVSPDWVRSPEGKDIMSCLMHRNQMTRRVYGLLEQPNIPSHYNIDEYQYKIFVSGKNGVGKTSTVASLCGTQVPPTHRETPGLQSTVMYWPARITDINKTVLFRLQFWDAGENSLKKFDHVMPACKDGADAIIFLFSFTDKSSFKDLPSQMSRVLEPNDNVCRFVIGTKLDQHSNIEINQRDVREFEAQWRLPIMILQNSSTRAAEVPELTPIINYICDQLWLRDQILAGRIRAPDLTDDPQRL